MISGAPSRTVGEKLRGWIQGRGKILGAAALIAVSAVVAYRNSFSGPYIFDDITSIPYNRSIHHLWPPWSVLFPAIHGEATINGRPLSNLSFALNYAVGSSAVWGFHLVNLVIHILAGIALMGVLRRTFQQPALRPRFGGAALPLALLIAVLWTVHPLQTESVTYLTQRCESMMGLFYLLTIYAFIRATEPGGGARWLGWSVAACFLGTLSKEAMISAPLVVLLYDRTFVSGFFLKALAQRKFYYAGLACTWPLLAWDMMRAGTRADTVGHVPGLTPWTYLLNQLHSITGYLRLAFWPYPQVFDYGPPEISRLSQVLPEALLILLLAGGTCLALRRVPTADSLWPVLGFLGGWFFLILAPSSSFVPVKDVMVEHRMYLPLAAVITLVVSGAYYWTGWRGAAVFILAVPVFMSLTVWRNNDYRTAVAIWADAVRKRPDNPRAHGNLAFEMAVIGQSMEALTEFREAVRLDPQDSKAHTNLGGILVRMGNVPEAMKEYETALKLDPKNGAVHTNMGILLARQGKNTEAMTEFEEALRCDDQDVAAHNNLGVLLADAGKLPEAVEQYRQAVEINPDYVEAHRNLGSALGAQGKFAEALKQYQEVLRLQPMDSSAHYNMAVALTGLGRAEEAVEQYKITLKLSPANGRARINLLMLQRQLEEPASTNR